MSNLRICVIGAGVVGLSTATEFQDNFPSALITLTADKFLTDTTSDGAGGLFRPSITFTGPTKELTIKWLKDSYDIYQAILEEDPRTAILAGIKRLHGFALSSDDPHYVQNYLLKEMIPDYRFCTQEELEEFPGAKYGTSFTTVLTECRRYLPFLTNKFKSRGGVVVNRKIENFAELTKDFDLVFNCSGLGAKHLCDDPTTVPIRGQVIKAKAPWVNQFVYFDYNTFIMPGFDSVTLGGTRQYENADVQVDRRDSEAIYENCTAVMPSLKNAKILREWVGLRPYRGRGVRIEDETRVFPGKRPLKIIHNYGHGGYGVMSAPGTAKYAVEIAAELLRANIRPKL